METISRSNRFLLRSYDVVQILTVYAVVGPWPGVKGALPLGLHVVQKNTQIHINVKGWFNVGQVQPAPGPLPYTIINNIGLKSLFSPSLY